MAEAASNSTYDRLRAEGPAKPTTPDEVQEVAGFKINPLIKGYLTRSSIYEREFPDKITQALCIDGPKDADNAMTFHSDGTITIMTGIRDPNKGSGSGKLNITAGGGQQEYKSRLDLTFNEGDDSKGAGGEGQALNVLCYGDYIEKSMGSERQIIAEKILIRATSEVVIKGGSVKIQSESDIEMGATSINSVQFNKKETVFGQIMKFGAGEETGIQFDPRSSVNIISPGHVNHKILGDYVVNVGGQEEHLIGGVPRPDSTLVKDKSKAFNVKAAALGIGLDAATFFTATGGGAVTVTAGAAMTLAAGAVLTQTATGGMFASTSGTYKVNSALDFEIKNALGASIKSLGALIYLN